MHLISHGVPSIMTRFLAFRDCYSGYFADPDGHLWEIAYNPFLEMDATGNAVGMKDGLSVWAFARRCTRSFDFASIRHGQDPFQARTHQSRPGIHRDQRSQHQQ
jgi:hypothetical protein